MDTTSVQASSAALDSVELAWSGTEERRRLFVALYRDGCSTTEIARAFDVNPTTVQWHLQRAGIALRTRGEGLRLKARHGPERQAEIRRQARERLQLATRPGRCGVPGCDDPDCSTPFGRCHCGCGAETSIADRTSAERGCVRGSPMLFVQHHAGCGSATRRDARRAEVARLYVDEGRSLLQIAELVGCTPPTVIRDLEEQGIARRPRGTVGGPPRKYAAPSPRLCEHCGAEFTPRRGLDVARGYARYCSRRCYQDAVATRRVGTAKRCLACGREFVAQFPVRTARRRFCSQSCATTYVWREGTGAAAVIVEMMSGKARRKLKRRWLGRKNGVKGAEHGREGGRPREYDEKDIIFVRELRDKNPKIGQREIARRASEERARRASEDQHPTHLLKPLSKRQVFEILHA